MNTKKLVAPIVITLILIIYLGSFVFGILMIPEHFMLKLLGIIIPIIFMGFSINALIDRIKELRSGEEDDISKY